MQLRCATAALQRHSSSVVRRRGASLSYSTAPYSYREAFASKDRRSWLSSTTTSIAADQQQPQPLFLWLGSSAISSDGKGDDNDRPRVLLPPSLERTRVVSTVEDVLRAVNTHYASESASQQFVGGMGEQDPGVWFAPLSAAQDTLHFAELIRESVEAVKEERHGVPFGAYTSGVLADELPCLADLGLDTFQVSLFAASPVDYEKATGRSKSDFGAVCSFIAAAAEEGSFGVEASVLKRYASEARDLAMSLGARNVHVYEE